MGAERWQCWASGLRKPGPGDGVPGRTGADGETLH